LLIPVATMGEYKLNHECIYSGTSIMDTLGPAISGSFLLLYRGFPLSEVKNVLAWYHWDCKTCP